MFKNLSTSTKLFILCGMFIAALSVTTYSLVMEKRIAIDFAQKQLTGVRYLATIRDVYDAVLSGLSGAAPPENGDAILAEVAAVEAEAEGLDTPELAAALAQGLARLWSGGEATEGASLEALDAARLLALRVGDDSNLSLDYTLDVHHLQNTAVSLLPTLLGRLGELATLRDAAGPEENDLRRSVVEGLIGGTLDETGSNLAAAWRGNQDGTLRTATEAPFATMTEAVAAYVGEDGVSAGTGGDFMAAVDGALAAWAVALDELDRLLEQRIGDLVSRLNTSLLVTGVLGALSILVAVLTHRHIVTPLQRFEKVARTISQTKDYSLRVEADSRDEIGRLAATFNEMLAEIAGAREREMVEQSELARVTRLTTMGAMTASIAHEINQPLAAIVTNSNAAMRWLGHQQPDLNEARAALKRIVSDGHRASQVIGSIRAIFRKDGDERSLIVVNDLIDEVLPLAQGNLQRVGVSAEAVLDGGVPPVLGDRVQLQQVLLNLISNGAEAMAGVTDRPKVLRIRSIRRDDPDGALITVTDVGTGIAKGSEERIFQAFFSTKSSGMGMGLFICRSIVESHGGRLWATNGEPCGSTFSIALPPGRAAVS